MEETPKQKHHLVINGPYATLYENKDAYWVDEISGCKYRAIFAAILSILFGFMMLCIRFKAEPMKSIKVKYSFLMMIPIVGGVIWIIYGNKLKEKYIEAYGHEPKKIITNKHTGASVGSFD